MKRFDVPKAKIGKFEERAEKIQRKAEKFDTEFDFEVNRDEEHLETVKVVENNAMRDPGMLGGNNTREVPVAMVPVMVTGEEKVKIGDYEVIAALDFVDDGEVVIRGGDEDLFKDADPDRQRCDHCGHSRQRKKAYIVEGPEGERLQVGSTCLTDYTGHKDAESLAAFYSTVRDLFESVSGGWASAEELGFRDKESEYREVVSFLNDVDRVIQEHGWTSGGDAYENGGISTANQTLRLDEEEKYELYERHEEAEYDISAALEWARGLEPDNSYENNIKVLANSEVFNVDKHAGYVASILPAYRRHKESQKEAENSEWVGEEGERLRDKTITLQEVKPIGGRFDDRRLFKFTDEDENILVWFTSTAKSFDPCECCGRFTLGNLEDHTFEEINMTVKDHNDFHGTKQTIVSRLYFPEAK